MIYLIFFDYVGLIKTVVECYHSSNLSLKLATLHLFHGLSRSVDQLRRIFNDTICDIILDAVKSDDLSIVKIASSVITNALLGFSTCRPVISLKVFSSV